MKAIIEAAFVLVFATILAIFALIDAPRMDVRFGAAAFLFGLYCAFVASRTSGRKREMSLLAQTALGVVTAVAIAFVLRASAEWYLGAAVLGLALGFVADKWVEHIQFP